jgi:hypothetical protein
MSIRNQRTQRHEDDIAYKLYEGTATVQDVVEHAQEIIVETPQAFGSDTATVVRLLLDIIDKQAAGERVEQFTRVTPEGVQVS